MPPKRVTTIVRTVVPAASKPVAKTDGKPSAKPAAKTKSSAVEAAAAAAAAAAGAAAKKKAEELARQKEEEERMAALKVEEERIAKEEAEAAALRKKVREEEARKEKDLIKRGKIMSKKQKEEVEKARARLGIVVGEDGKPAGPLKVPGTATAESPKATSAEGADDASRNTGAILSTVQSEPPSERLRSPILCVMGHVDTGKTKILDSIRRTNVQGAEAGGITQQIGATYLPHEAIEDKRAPLYKWVQRVAAEDKAKGRTGGSAAAAATTVETGPMSLGGKAAPVAGLHGDLPDHLFELLRQDDANDLSTRLPGLLVIDTPGHEAFQNLRHRGSSLCDIAILVIDIMHGLEAQTVESIQTLRAGKIPFVVALNKIDRIVGWEAVPGRSSLEALRAQSPRVLAEFREMLRNVEAALAGVELNAKLYWENDDMRRWVSLVPTSAFTGEGVPDLLHMMMLLTRRYLSSKITRGDSLQCTILEVKQEQGMGTVIDVILVNGSLNEGDDIVVCGIHGPIQTKIRAICTPKRVQDLRAKGHTYNHNKRIYASMGARIQAANLEDAVAGSNVFVVPKGASADAIAEIHTSVQADLKAAMSRITLDDEGKGVYVVASSLGSLEALLCHLEGEGVPVSGVSIGTVFKKDIVRAATAHDRGYPQWAAILAFNVQVAREARDLAAAEHVRLFEAEIIYHLTDSFKRYRDEHEAKEKDDAMKVAVFPAVVEVIQCFNQKNPLVMGVKVIGGQLRLNTPLCFIKRTPATEATLSPQLLPIMTASSKSDIKVVGAVVSIEKDKKPVDRANVGDIVAIKIETKEPSFCFGKHMEKTDILLSAISLESIQALKDYFKKDMTMDDWKIVAALKFAQRLMEIS